MKLLILLLMSNLVYAQYSERDLESMEIEARARIESGQNGYELYPKITHAIRIQRGLYSLDQIPYLLELIRWNQGNKDYESALNVGSQARWILSRNPDGFAIRELASTLMYYDPRCFDKSDGLYRKQTKPCISERKRIADAHIYALELLQRVKEDNAVWLLAGFLAWMVEGIDGPPFDFQLTETGFIQVPRNIHPKYRPETYLDIQRRAEGR